MRVSHWLLPVTTLGPGRRLAVWLQGCSHHCCGCVSPELQQPGGIEYHVEELAQFLNRQMKLHSLDGITISGGEPFDQAMELLELCSFLEYKDILVYSGYTAQELYATYRNELRDSPIGVLITGPYIEELDDDQPLRGSSNQEILFQRPDLQEKYHQYLDTSVRKQQFFIQSSVIYMAGLPPAGKAQTIRDTITNVMEEQT